MWLQRPGVPAGLAPKRSSQCWPAVCSDCHLQGDSVLLMCKGSFARKPSNFFHCACIREVKGYLLGWQAAMTACAYAEKVALGLHPCCACLAVLHGVWAVASVIDYSTCYRTERLGRPSQTSDCCGCSDEGQKLAWWTRPGCGGDCSELEGLELLRSV